MRSDFELECSNYTCLAGLAYQEEAVRVLQQLCTELGGDSLLAAIAKCVGLVSPGWACYSRRIQGIVAGGDWNAKVYEAWAVWAHFATTPSRKHDARAGRSRASTKPMTRCLACQCSWAANLAVVTCT